MVLDDLSYIESIDRSNMRDILKGFSEQCARAIEMGKKMDIPSSITKGGINKVVVCGLGGSAIGGDILRTLFFDRKILIEVSRDYYLPSFVDRQTLIFAVSYSGNTEETISSFKQALSAGYPIVSMGSGGELQKLSRESRVPFIQVPSGMPPRCAIGFLSIPAVILLERITGEYLFNYQELIEVISDMCKKYLPEEGINNNLAKSIALRVKGKVPLIYGVNRLTDVVAHRLKTQFNENSKVIASWDVFPELNHNEIVPFSGEGEVKLNIFHPIFIRDKKESERIAKRIQITQSLFKKEGVEYSEIWTEGSSFLTRIFSSIYTGDWVSFYLAVLQGVDPTPITFIDLLKNELKKF